VLEHVYRLQQGLQAPRLKFGFLSGDTWILLAHVFVGSELGAVAGVGIGTWLCVFIFNTKMGMQGLQAR